MDFDLEGDGVISNFYKLIWEKQENDKGLRGFLLPHTVVYKHQQPRAWYFSNAEGCIKRKLKEKLTANHIEDTFLKQVSLSGIIAFFTYVSEKGKEIEYFQASELRNFLYNRHKTFDGVLQKFVDPNGSKNSVIQMVWTPHLCVFEMRENLNSLFDLRLDVYERVITFEEENHQSCVKTFKGTELRCLMQEVGEALVEHFAIVSNGKTRPTRMAILFKTDAENRLCLIMPMSIRCNSLLPIDIACTAKFPAVVNCKRGNSNVRNPVCVQKKVLCLSCEQPCEVDRMYEIRYRNILKRSQKQVPAVIKKCHPRLDNENFLIYKNDESFLSRVILVCDECYLSFVKQPMPKKIFSREDHSKTPVILSKSTLPTQRLTPTPLTTDRTIKTPTRLSATQTMTRKKNYPSLPVLKFYRSAH